MLDTGVQKKVWITATITSCNSHIFLGHLVPFLNFNSDEVLQLAVSTIEYFYMDETIIYAINNASTVDSIPNDSIGSV